MSPREELRSPSIFIGKQGNDIISFGSGQPDLPHPVEVTEGLSVRFDLRYGLIQGEYELRKALSLEYSDSTADNFIITNGASEALDIIFRAMGRGKVLLPRPYYYSYPKIVRFAGMEPVYTDLKDGRIDMDDFNKKIKDCKAVLINSPSNPTGRIERIETLKEIEEITRNRNIYIVSDEVYKDLIYERENYHIKGNHVITVNSFSKTYAMCGVRVGYLWSSDQEIVNKAIEIKTHTSMNTSLIAQDMALNATKAPKTYIKNQQKIWLARRDIIFKGLWDLGFNLWKPEGAFYVFPEFASPEKLVWDLYTKYKVIIYLGDWFGTHDRIRLSYALDSKEIEDGLNRIETALKKEKYK